MSLENYPVEQYSPDVIQESYLILHPQILERYDITLEEFYAAFPRWSNFSQLKYPIVDEYGIEYGDSEWYYMAQRFESVAIKKKISDVSKTKWQSKNEAYKYAEFMNNDDNDRIEFMRNAIREKFNGSKWRNQMLLDTGERNIIEFTYWGDDFFGICNKTRQWRNILGKLLMEYRDNLLDQLKSYE